MTIIYNLIEVSKPWSLDSLGIFFTIEKLEEAINELVRDNHAYFGGTNNEDFEQVDHYRAYICKVDPDLSDAGWGQRWFKSYDKFTGKEIVEENPNKCENPTCSCNDLEPELTPDTICKFCNHNAIGFRHWTPLCAEHYCES